VAADSARLIASIGLAQATGDRHAILVGQSTCRLYELYDLHHTSHGWAAGSGATWDLRSNHLRPAGWTPTPPGCRSSPASPAGGRSRAA
jgi:hypothetical protein